MHKRSKEKSGGRVKWVEMCVSGDLQQKDTSKNERGGLQDSSKTCYNVWFGDLHP